MFRTFSICLLLTLTACPVLSGPDPMQPAALHNTSKPVEKVVDSSHWRLNLIRQTGDVRVALLNGRLVNVGERVDGALVAKIDSHQVTLRLPDHRSIKLKLPSAQLRRARD